MFRYLLFILIVSFTELSGEAMKEIDQRIERMQSFRVGHCCTVPWKGSIFRAEILAIQGNSYKVRVLDHSLPLGKWPVLTVQKEALGIACYPKSTSQEELIKSLKRAHILATPRIEQAFRIVDRAWFCSENFYYDAAIDIGCSMCISSPHIHIWTLELVRSLFEEATSILDVGTGSGYMAAILAQLSPNAKVYGIDYFEQLVQSARGLIAEHLPHLSTQITFLRGIGEEGYEEGAPYDIITVGYMCEGIPESLFNQLKIGGRLILPTTCQFRRSSYDARLIRGDFVVVEKLSDGSPRIKRVMPCSFLPSQK